MNIETSLKKFLKRKIKITTGFVTAFLITGSVSLATETDKLFPKEEDTEIVFFLNGGFQKGDLKDINNIGNVKLIPGGEVIKPPIELTPIEPSKPIVKPETPETIPGIDIIKPGEPGGPIVKPEKPETIPGIDIIKPGEPGGPTTKPQENINEENKVSENKVIFDIKANETFKNKGNLTLKSDTSLKDLDDDGVLDFPQKEAFIIKNEGGTVINDGTLKLEGIIDTTLTDSTGKPVAHVKTGEGIAVYQKSGTFTNNGDIIVPGNGHDLPELDGNTSIEAKGGIAIYQEEGTVVNKGNILGQKDPNLIRPMGIGIKTTGGTATNQGKIDGMHYGMSAEYNGTVVNEGTIKASVYGMEALIGGTAINKGIIEAGEKEALYISNAKGYNEEKGIINGNVAVEYNGSIVNKGVINGNVAVDSNGAFHNEGTLTGEEIKAENGVFVQSENAQLNVSRFNGDIYLAGDYTKNNFEDKISVNTDNINIKEHNGEIKSNSIMFDYNDSDKTLERKEFSEIIDNKNIAEYLENNYKSGVNDDLRVDLTNNLKDISTVKEFNRATNNLFGNDIYPTINKQTFDMLRYNRNTIYSQVFDKETNKETRFIGGADYKTFDVDSSNLSGYKTDIQSIFIGMDKKITDNNRLGGILNIGRMNTKFDMNNAEREDTFFQGNLYNIYQTNNWKLVNNFFFGINDGNIERDLKVEKINTRQKADIDTSYIGLNNTLTRKYDLNSFYVTPKLEFNITQLMNSEIKEDGDYGLAIDKQDVMSVEAGIGVEIGKEILLSNDLKAEIKLSGTYLAELSDPYEEINVKLRQINHSESVKLEKYDNEDYKDISIKLELSNDSISSYAEYKYLFDESIATMGVSYKF